MVAGNQSVLPSSSSHTASTRCLRDAGFGAKQLTNPGYGVQQLQCAGYGVKKLKGLGFDAIQLLLRQRLAPR